MFTYLKKKIIIIGIIGLLFFPANPAWAITLGFTPSTQTVAAGTSFDVDIVISGLKNDDLAGFDLEISFDDSILHFNSYTLGSELGDVSLGDADDWSLGDLGNGTVNISELSFLLDLSAQSDSFTLATFSFTGLNAGTTELTSALTYSRVLLSDTWGGDLASYVTPASVTVAPVPEPCTLLLLATGIAGLIRFRKKETLMRT